MPACNTSWSIIRPVPGVGQLKIFLLTHWGRDEIDAITQTTFSSAFFWMKMFEFRLKFHWSLFLRVQLAIFQHWFRWWLGADQVTSHSLNQWWLVYWRIYASLGLNELIHPLRTYAFLILFFFFKSHSYLPGVPAAGLQFSCNDTCQTWTWYVIDIWCFDNSQIFFRKLRNKGNCLGKPDCCSPF